MNFHRITIAIFALLLASSIGWGQSENQNVPTSCPFTVTAAISHPSCHDGADGFVELMVDNAIAPVSVEWLDLSPNQTNASDANFLKAGIYRASIQDGTGCIDTIFIELNNPPLLVTVNLFRENVRCFGESNGAIDLEPDDPSKVRAYYINGQEMPMPANSTRPRFRDLQPGNYLIAIEDINGCFQEDLAEITEPDVITVDTDKTPTTCPDGNDGSLSVNVSGGVGDYLYSLDGVEYEQEGVFNQLEPKEYQLYVKDGNDCIKSRTFVINAPPEPVVRFEKEDVTCPGGDNAKFIVIIETVGMNPASGYEYSIDGDSYQSSNQFENLKAGVYEVHSKSPKNCITIETVVVDQPDEPIINFQTEEVTCPGGNDASFIVIIETVGLQADDEYEFSLDGVEYQADSLFENLSAGVYQLSARNQNHCVATGTVIITEPEAPKLNFEKEDVTCPGGNDGKFIIIIETVGLDNQQDYEYSLDNLDYQPDSLFDNMAAGAYTVFARNTNQCVSSSQVLLLEPGAPSFGIEKENITCHNAQDGQIEIQVTGNSAYQYSLNGSMYQSDAIFKDLEAGNYTINIQDASGCIFTESTLLSQPNALLNLFTSEDATCGYANGWIASSLSGGTAPYEYIWNTGARTAVIADLIGGNYQLTVTDGNGCQHSDSIYLLNQDGPLLQGISKAVSCNGESDGAIDLDIETFGKSPEIIWSNGAQTEDIQNLTAGHYAVTVIDQNHCSNSEQFTINEPQELFATGQVEKVGNTGAISLDISGGTQPYFYSWSNGAEDNALQDLPPGEYTVTISDGHQCEVTSHFVLLPAERPMDQNLNIYPVPTLNQIYLKFDLAETESVRIEILDELGRLMYNMPEIPILHDLITLDLTDTAAGAYFVRIYLNGEVIVKRVVKVMD